MSAVTPLLEVRDITKRFTVSRGLGSETAVVHAVEGVSLAIAPGETLGLVGESGCGKSTVGRLIMRLPEPTAGQIMLDGEDITHAPHGTMRPLRRRMQMIFQDPYASLNPRMRAGAIVAEPLLVHGISNVGSRREKTAELFARVGLRPDQLRNFPSQFSGGQRQRLAIARALALDPALIVADEPVSALDVSIQAQVINLMADIQRERGLSYLFISHDLGIVQHISDRVIVMYLGRVVETGTTADLFAAPRHPYTRALLAAVPRPDPKRRHAPGTAIKGEVPSPLAPPPGCAFHPRCALATERCRQERPLLRLLSTGTKAACHNVE
jgi:oligopeptide/dipeptide ABC transporter ATP-binding protein